MIVDILLRVWRATFGTIFTWFPDLNLPDIPASISRPIGLLLWEFDRVVPILGPLRAAGMVLMAAVPLFLIRFLLWCIDLLIPGDRT